MAPHSDGPDTVSDRTELARELATLRARSGLTVRELARRLGAPTATVGDYFSGRHLPGPGQLELFCALLSQCGVSDPAQRAAWLDALNRARLATDGRVARTAPPYRGLEPFQTEDAQLFFGRAAATERILGELASLCAATPARGQLVMVVGPSGCGKSSLLRAGVVPAVKARALSTNAPPWQTTVMTPGDVPDKTLHECLQGAPEGAFHLVVVDQFEEVFSAPGDAKEAFLDRLTGALPPTAFAVCGLRADFYQAAATEPRLLPALQRAQVLVEPMTDDEVRQAIVGPARRLGVSVEEGLVDLLVADLAPRRPSGFAHDAGSLPLLSHALRVTWEHARGNQLTIAGYRASGGLHGAISQSAEQLYNQLDEPGKDLARRIFCRLVSISDDAPLTRRRVARTELVDLGDLGEGGRPGAEEVLDLFVRARLVTASEGIVELSHEALLTAWPRLGEWLDADRDGLRLHHRLAEATNAWLAGGKDASALLRGARLQVAAEWAGQPGRAREVNRSEREFLDAGLALADAEDRASRRRTRRSRQLLGTVAALALVTSLLAAYALAARSEANSARDQALSRQVAIEASQLEASDPGLAMQLALAAYRISPTLQARSTLLDSSAYEMPTSITGAPGPAFVSMSADGTLLAIASSATDTVAVFSLASGHPVRLARLAAGPSSDQVFTVAISPNGQLLAAGGTDKRVTLWGLAGPGRPTRLASLGGFSSTVYSVAFSPSGTQLAAADNDGTLRQWAVLERSGPALDRVLASPQGASLHALGYSSGGGLLAAAGSDGTLATWSVGTGRLVSVAHGGTSVITSLAFNPDGRALATGGEDDLVRVWAVGLSGRLRQERAPLEGFTSWVNSVAFSRHGRSLAAGSSDGSLAMWATAGWQPEAALPSPAPVTSVAFTPDGRGVVSADANGTTRLWSLPVPSSYVAPGSVFNVDYTAGGKLLAAVSGGPRGNVSLWDVANPWLPVQVGNVDMPAAFGPVAGVGALSPGGHLLAVGNARAQVQLVDVADPAHPVLVGPLLLGASPDIEQIVLNTDGKVLAIGDDAGHVHLWDVADPAHPRALPTLGITGPARNVLGLAFSPNGRLIAAASADTKVWLWDIANLAHPEHLATVGGFANYAYTVAFSPNGRALVAGSADGTLRIWDLAHPSRPRPIGGPLTGPGGYVYSVAVSPGGHTLAASTTNGAVWLWDISSAAHPKLEADLSAATGEVFDVTFSPNGRTLVATGTDRTLSFLGYHPAQVAERICALAGAPVTRSEWAQYVQGARYNPPCR